jgi:hypothetical protein
MFVTLKHEAFGEAVGANEHPSNEESGHLSTDWIKVYFFLEFGLK